MTSVISWQNSVSLYPASFCTSRPNLSLRVSLDFLHLHSNPIMIIISFLALSFEDLAGHLRTFHFSGWGINLDYCDAEWFVLEMNGNHSVIFETALKQSISDLCVSFVACIYDHYYCLSQFHIYVLIHCIVSLFPTYFTEYNKHQH